MVLGVSLALLAFRAQAEVAAPSILGTSPEQLASDIQRGREWHEGFKSARSQGDVYTRNQIIGQVGEKWAITYAKDQRWEPLWAEVDKTRPQGVDQIWKKPDGTIVAVEVKGGNSTLLKGYKGSQFNQGTIEYSILQARDTILSPTASAQQKLANQQLLEAIKSGKAESAVIRVPHENAVASAVGIEKTHHVSAKSAKMAGKVLDGIEATAAKVAPKAAQATSTAGKLAGTGGKVLVGVGVVGGAAQAYQGVSQIQAGHYVQGATSLVGGSANAGSSGLALAGKIGASTALGGVAAVVDGGVDIYQAVQDGDVCKGTIGSVKATAGAVMLYSAAAGQPEIAIPAAVVYGGIVVGELVVDNKEALSRGVGRGADAVAEVVGNWIPENAYDYRIISAGASYYSSVRGLFR